MYIIGAVLGLILTAVIIFIKDKNEYNRWLAGFFFLCGLGSLSSLLTNLFNGILNSNNMDLVYHISAWLSVSAHYLAPVCILIYALLNADLINKNKKMIYTVLFIPQILCYLLLPIEYNDLKTTDEFLHYMRIVCIVELPYLCSSVALLIYSYAKEKSYLMKKYKLIHVIIIVPGLIYIIIFNFVLRAMGIENFWKLFAVLVPMYFIVFIYLTNKFALFGVTMKFDKYNFAFENIIDYITDSIIIIDEKLKIKEVNDIFYEKFQLNKDKKYREYGELIKESSLKDYEHVLTDLINNTYKTRTNQSTQITMVTDEVIHFDVQVNCVIHKNDYFGAIIFIKDITAQKRNIELIIEKERLESLSKLIGGVAHNLKTPIMSVAGGLSIIKKDVNKLSTYLNNNDSSEIEKLMNEINSWNERGQTYLRYMTDIINATKSQLKDFDLSKIEHFIVKDVIKKIGLLMSFELKKNKCKLIQEIKIDENEEVEGDINSLIQVLNNLISNAINAVNEDRNIIFSIYKENENVIFSIENEGIIHEHIQKKIFSEMFTTKGKDGTGLGLYISKAIIKVRFEGEIYFKSDNRTTTFFVKIPCKKEIIHE
ncbi:MAG: ATP-binding protein [Clostridiaceae bacterium]